jgi:hypothetical protein
MLKFPLQVGQEGIVYTLITHVLDRIVFRDGVVELDGVGVFVLVGKKSLKERQLLRTGTLQGHEFAANISTLHTLIDHRAPPMLAVDIRAEITRRLVRSFYVRLLIALDPLHDGLKHPLVPGFLERQQFLP